MFKRTIVLHSIEDARDYLNNISDVMSNSNLNPAAYELLKDQIVTTLKQIEHNMDDTYTGALNINRVLEGDGYRVIIKGSKKKPGILSRLFRKS